MGHLVFLPSSGELCCGHDVEGRKEFNPAKMLHLFLCRLTNNLILFSQALFVLMVLLVKMS